ncbi:MAG: dihydroxyacetone kinase subunit DhaL [Candidatus Kaistia colombiensis]|nr:MAG: dihydroxyacetone kinase subunit DhaL [Kaistia sp.]
MKKLINSTSSVVDEMIEGIVATSDRLAMLAGARVVVRSDFAALRDAGKVALISGGGSGHEPAHAGYVGQGMLTAAVCGDVFTSPSTDAVLAAIRTVGGPAGVLLIVKNYTGDRLNFGLAAELARAEGLDVRMVVVADDVALAQASETAGRRGLAGTVLVHKIAGAAAEAGLSLGEVSLAAQQAIDHLATMGVGLSPCIVPAAGKPNFTLAEDEIEFGLGIHGEAGVTREPFTNASDIVQRLCARVFDSLRLAPGDPVALLINNLGATPAMEMAIVAREALDQAVRRGLVVDAIWVGSFLTAIEMAGCSITALKLRPTMLEALRTPTAAPAWPGAGAGAGVVRRVAAQQAVSVPDRGGATAGDPRIRASLQAVIGALVEAESYLTGLDQQVGDGDLGLNLARGAKAIEAELDNLAGQHPADLLRSLSAITRRTVGGTSGALYAAGLLRAATTLQARDVPDRYDWSRALGEGARAIAELGDARIGDRTMLDALLPAVAVLEAEAESPGDAGAWLDEAVSAARRGVRDSSATASRRGRSSYLGARVIGVPDPGAEAVVVWLQAIRHALG